LVGNTGSGKSWTVASAVQRCLEALQPPEQYRPKFIVLDINGEYAKAFGTTAHARQPNHVYVNSHEYGLPLWTFDLHELVHYFEASAATQVPVLDQVVTLARATGPGTSPAHHQLLRLDWALGLLRALVAYTQESGGKFVGRNARKTMSNLHELLLLLRNDAEQRSQPATRQAADAALTALQESSEIEPLLLSADQDEYYCFTGLDVQVREGIQSISQSLEPLLASAHSTLLAESGLPPLTADIPCPFPPPMLDEPSLFDSALSGMRGEQRMHEYVATLRLRIRRKLQDRRWRVFRGNEEDLFTEVLCPLLGLDFIPHQGGGDTGSSSSQALPEDSATVVIIDCSMLAHDVLPFFCAVVGRLLLDVREHANPDQRINRPWVLVLEEAHNYLRPRREGEDPGLTLSREAFERIAKEGRKFGMSLIIASQRPSDVSDTVLSQCANFIVHRIQNPDDIDYFKRILPGGSREMLDQVSILSPGEALPLGSAVNVPCRVRVHKPNPSPKSDTPAPRQHWKTEAVFDIEKAIANWLGQEDIGHD